MSNEKSTNFSEVEETSILSELDKWIERRYQFPPAVNEIKELREQMVDTFLKEQKVPEENMEQKKYEIIKLIKAENAPNKGQNSTVSDLPPGAEF